MRIPRIVLFAAASWAFLGICTCARHTDAKLPGVLFMDKYHIEVNGNSYEVLAAFVMPSFLSQSQFPKPYLGRSLEQPDLDYHRKVVVLGYDLWQRISGNKADIIGTQLKFNSSYYVVVGVMPASFSVPSGCELWSCPAVDFYAFEHSN